MPASSVRRLVALCLAAAPLSIAAQTSSAEWVAYPSYNSVVAVASGPDAVWAGVSGGVFSYAPSSGEITRYTVVDGLSGTRLTALGVDPRRGDVWVGYDDGVLNRIDPETGGVASVFDLTRADQYASRGVRRLRFAGDSLLISTDFGLVVYDLERDETRDTYARFAELQAATPVNDAIAAPLPDGRPGLWVATDAGVVTAPLDGGNLQVASSWTRDSAFAGSAFSLGSYRGVVYVGGGPDGARDLYRSNGAGGYERQLFIDNPILDLAPLDDGLAVVDAFALRVLYDGGGGVSVEASLGDPRVTSVAAGPDGRVWVGDAQAGLYPVTVPERGGADRVSITPESVRPDGPVSNELADVAVGPDRVAWVASRRINGSSAVSRLEGGEWTSFTDAEVPDLFNGPRSASVGPDGTFYFGSNGQGLIAFAPDGAVTAYERGNSSLVGPTTAPDLVVVADVGFEGDRRWVLNQGSPFPMHLFDADGNWAGLPYPRGISSSTEAHRIAVDGFGRKWLALFRVGVGVWDTGADPANPADDMAVLFSRTGTNGQDLPDNDVRDVVADLDGGLWIGTGRGIAYVFSPGSAITDGRAGDPAISWPIVAGTETQGADYLLRDVSVNDLEVDPAGRLWVATSTGAYLVRRSRDGLELSFDSETSPLPSDDVISVSVDPTSGRVFFATRQGLVAYQGDATAPRPGASALTVTPSPFRPSLGDTSVLVSGLPAAESAVRIVTVGGDVVFRGAITGGSFRWDGRDDRTREPVASGVYLVVAAGSGGEGGVVGKIAVVR